MTVVRAISTCLWFAACIFQVFLLPVVDPGLFVISGVMTCGAGEGYCLLGLDCTLDADFLPDPTGHCEGLKNAFTPSAYFSCCKVNDMRPTPPQGMVAPPPDTSSTFKPTPGNGTYTQIDSTPVSTTPMVENIMTTEQPGTQYVSTETVATREGTDVTEMVTPDDPLEQSTLQGDFSYPPLKDNAIDTDDKLETSSSRKTGSVLKEMESEATTGKVTITMLEHGPAMTPRMDVFEDMAYLDEDSEEQVVEEQENMPEEHESTLLDQEEEIEEQENDSEEQEDQMEMEEYQPEKSVVHQGEQVDKHGYANHPSMTSVQPETNEVQPVVNKNQPEILRTRPISNHVRPEMTKIQLETAKPRPGMVENRPEMTMAQAEMNKIRPVMTEVRPEMVKPHPEITKIPPMMTKVRPEVIKAQPDIMRIRPVMTEVRPEMTKIRPEVSKTQPETHKTRADSPKKDLPETDAIDEYAEVSEYDIMDSMNPENPPMILKNPVKPDSQSTVRPVAGNSGGHPVVPGGNPPILGGYPVTVSGLPATASGYLATASGYPVESSTEDLAVSKTYLNYIRDKINTTIAEISTNLNNRFPGLRPGIISNTISDVVKDQVTLRPFEGTPALSDSAEANPLSVLNNRDNGSSFARPRNCDMVRDVEWRFQEDGQTMCYGVLIDAVRILTSASCVLKLFESNMAGVSAVSHRGNNHSIGGVTVHENFQAVNNIQSINKNDLGIVTLKATVPYGDQCIPKLPFKGQILRNMKCSSTHDDDFESKSNPILSRYSSNYLKTDFCSHSLSTFEVNRTPYLTLACQGAVAADTRKISQDTVGSGVICNGILAGIELSSGLGAKAYTPLSMYVDWINKNIKGPSISQRFRVGYYNFKK